MSDTFTAGRITVGPGGTGGYGVDRPSDALAVYVEEAGGAERRLAGDEPSLPLQDYTLATTLPGGFATADAASLLPEQGIEAFRKFAPVSFRLDDRTVVWEGRLESTPERSDERELSLSCIGHQAALSDDPSLVFLGVDCDLAAWEEPPAARVQLLADAVTSCNASFAVGISEAGITMRMDANNNVTSDNNGEAWYLAPAGQTIATVQYHAIDTQGSNMAPLVRITENLDGSSSDEAALASGALTDFDATTPARYAYFHDSPSITVNKTARVVRIPLAAVFADHGLTRVPIEDSTDGLLFSDILAHLLATYAPALRVTSDSLEPSSSPMPRAAWLEPTTLAEVIEEGISTEPDRDWAVWEGRTLHYGRRQSMGRVWHVRRSDGARWVNAGPSSEPDVNGCIVTYTDRDGSTKRVGPPGSGADTEDASLADSDPENPVNSSGVIGNKPLEVQLDTTTAAKAIEIGQLALSEALRPRFSGEVEVPPYAMTSGRELPSVLMRAGDRIIDGDSIGGEEMLLVGTGYTRSKGDRPLTATIDLPANRLDAAIAGMGATPRTPRIGRMRHKLRRQARQAERKRRTGHKLTAAAMRRRRRANRGVVGPNRGGSASG